MPPYQGRGTHGQVVELLGRRIIAGDPPEGATLDLRSLGTELDISLSVLRESVKVLTAKGLLDARQKRGTFVRPRSAWNLLDSDVLRWQAATGNTRRLLNDLEEVRAIIEPAAARYAATRRTPHHLAALERALERMASAAGHAHQTALADVAFHRALLSASGNELLSRMDTLLEAGLIERDVLVHSLNHQDDPVPSHQAVLDAIKDRQPATAELAMLDLLAKSAADAQRVSDETTSETSE